MPIRLLFLNTRDQCGADVAVHLSLMRSLSPDEVQVFVISNSDAVDADEMRETLAGIPHVISRFMPLGRPAGALSGKSKLGRALAYAPSVVSMARTAAFVRRHGIQIIHATDRPRDACYASILARATGSASVVHMHAHVSDLSRPTLWGMRNASAIFAVSNSIRANLIDLGLDADRIFTIHNAVDAEHFDPDRPAEAQGTNSLRERFRIPSSARVLGIAARMNPWKGHYELIGAAALLKDSHPDLHVIIVGADVPQMRIDFESKAREGGIADRVHFAGFQKDVRPFLREIDLFVHPSYGEPFGLSIVEAMAMRKAVIACDTGGVPEIITHGTDGWLVEERSTKAVADAISTLLQDKELARRIAARARQTVCSRFTPRQQSAAVTRQYTNLLAPDGLDDVAVHSSK